MAGPAFAGPLGHIELASATVDDPEMQLAMCTYTLSTTFVSDSSFASLISGPSFLGRSSVSLTNPRR